MATVRINLFVILSCILSLQFAWFFHQALVLFAFAYRQQRSASSKGNSAAAAPAVNGASAKQAQEVVVAYASQTGTAQEIARNIQAESSKHGIQSKVPHLLRIAVHELHQYKHAASHCTNRPFNTNAILQRVLQFMLLS